MAIFATDHGTCIIDDTLGVELEESQFPSKSRDKLQRRSHNCRVVDRFLEIVAGSSAGKENLKS